MHFSFSLVNAGINGLEKNAFAAIPSISVLDLSKNRIWDIDPDAFKDLGHSLQVTTLFRLSFSQTFQSLCSTCVSQSQSIFSYKQVLRMSHALYFDELPSGIFSRYLFTLQY